MILTGRFNIALRALAIALTALGLFAFAGTSSARAGCRNANLAPDTVREAKKASKAAACLVNAERRKRGIKSLRWNRRLRKASAWMTRDMLSHGYFAHDRADGPSFNRRILRFGFAANADGYTLGENIAYASAPIATAREMVKMWMGSPGHRANILRRGFREQGMAARFSPGAGGAYEGAGPVVVFVNQFGTRY